MKFVVTLSIDGGSGGGEFVTAVRTATTDASDVVTLSEPIVVRVVKQVPRIRYPVFYVRNFNAAPYESNVLTSVLSCSAESSSSSPTCGRAYATTGAPVPYSEGYCCSCSLCDLVTLCESDSRANINCNILRDGQAASCLRFGARWYSGYSIGRGQRVYTITINISVASRGWELLELSPESIGATSSVFGGVTARLVGDFAGFEQPYDFTSSMLFVPVGGPADERASAGPAEWLIVAASHVSVDGTSCNKIGVSYEGFNSQGSRCEMRSGSCTRNQIDDLRALDIAAIARGERGKYVVSSYGDFSYEYPLTSSSRIARPSEARESKHDDMETDALQQQWHYFHNTTNLLARHTATLARVAKTSSYASSTPYISYVVTDIAPSVVVLTIVADNLSYYTQVAKGVILHADMSSLAIAASSTHGTLRVVIRNAGLVPSEFSIGVVNCTTGTFPIVAQVAAIPPGSTFNATFNIMMQTPDVTQWSSCRVVLRNALQDVADVVTVQWLSTAVNRSDGAQGGESLEGGTPSVYDSAWSSVTCPACPWYSPLCFLQQRCFWGLAAELLGIVALLLVFVAVFKCRRAFTSCCRKHRRPKRRRQACAYESSSTSLPRHSVTVVRSSSDDDESHQRQKRRKRKRRRTSRHSPLG